jgi:hypothetical protein
MVGAAPADDAVTMPLRLLADVTAVTHLGYLLVLAAGPLLALRYRWVLALHVPAAAWALVSLGTGVPCPLTVLEKALRRAAGDTVYAGGFIDHYLEGTLYPAPAARGVAIAVALLVVAGYVTLWSRRPRVPA